SKRHANTTRDGSECGHQFSRRRLVPGHSVRYGHGKSHRRGAGWDYGSTALLGECRLTTRHGAKNTPITAALRDWELRQLWPAAPVFLVMPERYQYRMP